MLVAAPLINRARADIEFSDFGEPGNTHSDVAEYVVGSSDGGYQAYAGGFTASFTGILSAVDVAVIGYDQGSLAQSITLVLYQNNLVTSTPLVSSGVALGSITALTSLHNQGTVVTLTPDGTTIPLLAGSSYWLALTPTNDVTAAGWNAANYGGAAPTAISTDGGVTYQTAGAGGSTAFDIVAVPEPSISTTLGLAAGMLILGLHRRSRRA